MANDSSLEMMGTHKFGHNRSLDCLLDFLSYEAPTAGRPVGGVRLRFLSWALVVVGTHHVTHVANVMPATRSSCRRSGPGFTHCNEVRPSTLDPSRIQTSTANPHSRRS